MTIRRWQILLWLPVVTIDWRWFRPWWKPQRGIFPDCPEYGMPVTYDYWAWGPLEIRRTREKGGGLTSSPICAKVYFWSHGAASYRDRQKEMRQPRAGASTSAPPQTPWRWGT